MTNEIESKPVVSEGDQKAAAAESKPTINLVDLLKPSQSNAKDTDITQFPKDRDAGAAHAPGVFEILDRKAEKNVEDWSHMKAKDMKVEPLNRTESLILNNLQDAINSGSVESVQNMLATLTENPQSVARVLQQLKTQMESRNSNDSVNWEQGRDNHGNEFIRLNMSRHLWVGKGSSDSTNLTIGSDGRSSATLVEVRSGGCLAGPGYPDPRGTLTERPVSPQTALQDFAITEPKVKRDFLPKAGK